MHGLIHIYYGLNLLLHQMKTIFIINKAFETEELTDQLSVSFVTGPESGFSEEEKSFLSNNDVKMRLIGKNVLRAETAPLVISTLIQNHFGRI